MPETTEPRTVVEAAEKVLEHQTLPAKGAYRFASAKEAHIFAENYRMFAENYRRKQPPQELQRPDAHDEAQATMSAIRALLKQDVSDVRIMLSAEPRPNAEDGAQAAMSADIDAIVKRLDEGIPRLSARLDELLERQRRPLNV
jgi:hypothetical protein